jgi:chromosome segregation ATPase
VEDGLRIEMKGAYEQLNNARDEISSLRQELTMAKAREETLERTVAGLEGRVATQEADLEKRAIKIGELEDQIRRLQGLVRDLEAAAVEAAEDHKRELEFLQAEMTAKLRATEEAAKATKEELTAEVTRCKDVSAGLRSDLDAANAVINELRELSNKLRGQLSAEETAHTRTQNEKEMLAQEATAARAMMQQLEADLAEAQGRIRTLEAEKLQLEADLRMMGLNKEQLEAELERALGEERRLTSELAEEKAHCQGVQQRKEAVDKKLGQTEAIVDQLRVELDSLHMTNDELAQAAKKEIIALKDEIKVMKGKYDSEITRLHEQLMLLQADRDQMESAYQFAKDELAVIRATLAEMEEGQQRTQYIVEDTGNPVLVNRMASEWNRVDDRVGDSLDTNEDASPKKKAFSRDFRRAHHGSPPAEPTFDVGRVRQGKIGHSAWR